MNKKLNMRRFSIRKFWTNYKRGYGQVSLLLNASMLGLSLYTALVVSVTGIAKETLLTIIIVAGILAVIFMAWFGNWDYSNKRTFYKKDAEIEYRNNPFVQDSVRFNIELGKALGVDTSVWEKWLNDDQHKGDT